MWDEMHRDAEVFPAMYPEGGDRPLVCLGDARVEVEMESDGAGRPCLVVKVDRSRVGMGMAGMSPGGVLPVVLEIGGERVWRG